MKKSSEVNFGLLNQIKRSKSSKRSKTKDQSPIKSGNISDPILSDNKSQVAEDEAKQKEKSRENFLKGLTDNSFFSMLGANKKNSTDPVSGNLESTIIQSTGPDLIKAEKKNESVKAEDPSKTEGKTFPTPQQTIENFQKLGDKVQPTPGISDAPQEKESLLAKASTIVSGNPDLLKKEPSATKETPDQSIKDSSPEKILSSPISREKGKVPESMTGKSENIKDLLSSSKGFVGQILEKTKEKLLPQSFSLSDQKVSRNPDSSSVSNFLTDLTSSKKKNLMENFPPGQNVKGENLVSKKVSSTVEMKKKNPNTSSSPNPNPSDKDSEKNKGKEIETFSSFPSKANETSSKESSKTSVPSSEGYQKLEITKEDIADIKSLLVGINTALNSPLMIKNNKPFRPKSNMLE